MRLQYKPSDQLHERELSKLVKATLAENNRSNYASGIWFLKAITLLLAYIVCALVYSATDSFVLLLVAASLTGVLTIFLGISIGHDAAHNSIHPSNWVNTIGLGIFNFLGANGNIWNERHNTGHHPYPNIPGVDTDIEQSSLVKLEKSAELKPWHRWQFIYLPILLCLYTLNWFFHRDFKDLFSGLKAQGELKQKVQKIAVFIITKLWHFGLFLIVPMLYPNQAIGNYIIAFLVLHISASLIVAIVLLAAHVGEEQAFPVPDENGQISTTYFEHQLLTTADFATTNPVFNWFFGGFNHHVAHHLFPEINHVHYPLLTPVVKNYLIANNLPYLEHHTWRKSIKSHFRLLIREGEM